MSQNQPEPKIIQDLTQIDTNSLSGIYQEIYSGLKNAHEDGVDLIFATDFPTLDGALLFPFPTVVYDSTPVLLDNGYQARFAINDSHASLIGRALSRRSLFSFQLFMSKWMGDSMPLFLSSLKAGSSKISRLAINHVTGDEFTVSEAKGLAEWIEHCQVRAIILQTNEFDPGSIEMLTSELRRLKNKSLQEATIVYHDDVRETRSVDFSDLEKFVKENRRGDEMPQFDFDQLMKRFDGSLKNREYHDVEALATSLLASYKLTPEQAGWFADYRHRALFYIGTERSHREALRLLQNPDGEFKTSVRNRLWMISTGAEMAHQLAEKSLAAKLIETYLKENLQTPDETERGQNEVRCLLNAIITEKASSPSFRPRVIELLQAHPDWTDVIVVPEDIQKEIANRA